MRRNFAREPTPTEFPADLEGVQPEHGIAPGLTGFNFVVVPLLGVRKRERCNATHNPKRSAVMPFHHVNEVETAVNIDGLDINARHLGCLRWDARAETQAPTHQTTVRVNEKRVGACITIDTPSNLRIPSRSHFFFLRHWGGNRNQKIQKEKHDSCEIFHLFILSSVASLYLFRCTDSDAYTSGRWGVR